MTSGTRAQAHTNAIYTGDREVIWASHSPRTNFIFKPSGRPQRSFFANRYLRVDPFLDPNLNLFVHIQKDCCWCFWDCLPCTRILCNNFENKQSYLCERSSLREHQTRHCGEKTCLIVVSNIQHTANVGSVLWHTSVLSAWGYNHIRKQR